MAFAGVAVRRRHRLAHPPDTSIVNAPQRRARRVMVRGGKACHLRSTGCAALGDAYIPLRRPKEGRVRRQNHHHKGSLASIHGALPASPPCNSQAGSAMIAGMEGSDLGNYREALAVFIREHARPVDKYGHQPRLYALARTIAGSLDYDDDVLYAAVWLHDLGVFTGHRPEDPAALERWDSVAYTIDRVPDILTSVQFPANKIDHVVEAIRTHQPTGKPATVEAIILRDADILEQIGAVGVMRTVCKIGRDTRFTTFTSAVAALGRALGSLPSQLSLDIAREMAASRIRIMELFLDAVDVESGENLF
jgi:uncharacterized protein